MHITIASEIPLHATSALLLTLMVVSLVVLMLVLPLESLLLTDTLGGDTSAFSFTSYASISLTISPVVAASAPMEPANVIVITVLLATSRPTGSGSRRTASSS
jgi:hypothetical protein